jgi:hypothetical protein
MGIAGRAEGEGRGRHLGRIRTTILAANYAREKFTAELYILDRARR